MIAPPKAETLIDIKDFKNEQAKKLLDGKIRFPLFYRNGLGGSPRYFPKI